ncbi:hypothetical protein KIN20_003905 [Parelaphostrongylus tenuis]|uniref:Uncharacterized protein n=1 Tax=Parelaphostrongylus tenuis TaxID=148309 RepID=A0AAD5M299_PARTN|nr:hypothetical protein KIN20_003905 [Parelaphostrongylus tenuis]
MDTLYGLSELIDATAGKDEIEAFARPKPEDDNWVKHAHYYFDNEEPFKRKPPKAAVSRRLRIAQFHKGRWTSAQREMAFRHPIPANLEPLPTSEAMCESKLRPDDCPAQPEH